MASNEYEQGGQLPGPDPALRRLDRFVGTWEVTGRTLDSEADNVSGRLTFEWLPGGFFLQQRVQLNFAGLDIQGLEVIGYDAGTGRFPSTVYSNLAGSPIMYEYDVQGDRVTIRTELGGGCHVHRHLGRARRVDGGRLEARSWQGGRRQRRLRHQRQTSHVKRSGGPARRVAAGRDLGDDGAAHTIEVRAPRREDPRGRAPVVPHEAEQQVLGPDVPMPEPERLAERELERLLRAPREGDVPARRSAPARRIPLERARAERLLDRPAHLVQVDPDGPERIHVLVGERRTFPVEPPHVVAHDMRLDAEGTQRSSARSAGLVQDREQEVLRSDARVPQLACHVLRVRDDRPRDVKRSNTPTSSARGAGRSRASCARPDG